ncbi:hypothetical protein SAMD00019534_096620 [Acytostelium subglobosum LB1]|uniref:hypothetical protein n=1 Tax=Acytostelium subglobosum LB1 TaxID=1410327 RepID=UPI00064497C2|nr:hypothetical protein SAMD00019534_096620 [Acytostelium subglobosum LB1]GAM26487.1 hypothetical protein SAMD00019534_096620 [Acytostelium subglobosum LB1]|eukprot:XP_012750583.1 hypothetical protein SAMD00019534_096620 [Acytostelium subglobosum LB1]
MTSTISYASNSTSSSSSSSSFKENAPPKILGQAQSPVWSLNTERDQFERQIAECTHHDPLAIWTPYIKWAQQSYKGQGMKAELLALLQRCTGLYVHSDDYKNDTRYLRIWIIYADMSADPIDIFTFLENNGIGVRLALLYEAQAIVHENKGNFQQANACYQLGVERSAHPIDRIKQRYSEFKLRYKKYMARSNNSSNSSSTIKDQQHAGEKRKHDGGVGASSSSSSFQIYEDAANNTPLSVSKKPLQWQELPAGKQRDQLIPDRSATAGGAQSSDKRLKSDPAASLPLAPKSPSVGRGGTSTGAARPERVGYKKELFLLLKGDTEIKLSFEELRAQHWMAKRLSKPQPQPQPQLQPQPKTQHVTHHVLLNDTTPQPKATTISTVVAAAPPSPSITFHTKEALKHVMSWFNGTELSDDNINASNNNSETSVDAAVSQLGLDSVDHQHHLDNQENIDPATRPTSKSTLGNVATTKRAVFNAATGEFDTVPVVQIHNEKRTIGQCPA